MIRKKRTSLLMITLMLLVGLVGCGTETKKDQLEVSKEVTEKESQNNLNSVGELPIVKNKKTFRIATMKRHDVRDFSELEFFNKLEQETNIHIDWDISPLEGWNERKSLMFASNDLPDALFGRYILEDTDLIKYSSQGLLIPIEKYIDSDTVYLKELLLNNPNYKKEITAATGHIYSMPSINEQTPDFYSGFFMNKNWLDQVSMDVPSTTDEFYQALKAFKGKDLNNNGKQDEILYTFRNKSPVQGYYNMFGAFGIVDNPNHIMIKDDKVIYSAMEQGYKEAIVYFNKLFSEGLIDQEAFTQAQPVFVAKVRNKDNVVGAFNGWSLTWAHGTKEGKYVALPPLKGPNGDQIWQPGPSKVNNKGGFVITSKCEEPQVLIRWADQFFEPITAMEAYYGTIGTCLEKTSDGKYAFKNAPEGITQQDFAHQTAPGVSGLATITTEILGMLETTTEDAKEKKELDELYKPYQQKQVYPNFLMTAEELDKLSVITVDIFEYTNQMAAKWMLHGGIEEDWDNYIKKLKEMGVDEYINIKQGAYNRYLSN